jgi:hypothetical protein
LPLLFNVPLEYCIRKVQEILEGLELNGTHQLLVYVDIMLILLCEKINTIKNGKEALLGANREIGLVNEEKTKCMVMSCHQNAGQNHNLLIANKSFENMAKFNYLGIAFTVADQIQGMLACFTCV